jgi:ABC-type sulfate/molybdate transport systems ATPase subunit
VLLGLSARKIPRREAQRRARELLLMCKIGHLADRRPASVSGGQQQRVALARALAGQPRFLLLDEPFSSLDATTKADLIQDINRFREEWKITLVLVSHDPLEAVSLCQRAVVLNQGRIEDEGKIKNLLNHSKSKMLENSRRSLKELPSNGAL